MHRTTLIAMLLAAALCPACASKKSDAPDAPPPREQQEPDAIEQLNRDLKKQAAAPRR